MKKYLFSLSRVIGIFILFSCNSNLGVRQLSVSDEFGTISISNYTVKFGNSSIEPIAEGLKLILVELKKAARNKQNLKGTVNYTFRCEPNGAIRWMTAGVSELSVDNQDELHNEFIGHLMEKQIKFPVLGTVTMIEATIKFE